MDLSNITFNKNQKTEAAARDAATGVRLLMLAFGIGAGLLALAIVAKDVAGVGYLMLALSLACFAAGAYGSYLAASALDWSGFLTGVIILGAFVPYLKFVCFIVLIVCSMDLIRKAGYRFSPFGALRKRVVAEAS